MVSLGPVEFRDNERRQEGQGMTRPRSRPRSRPVQPLDQLEGLAVTLAQRSGPDALVRPADDGSGYVIRMGRTGAPMVGGWHSLDGILHPTERAARIAARQWLTQAEHRMGIAGAIMCGRNRR